MICFDWSGYYDHNADRYDSKLFFSCLQSKSPCIKQVCSQVEPEIQLLAAPEAENLAKKLNP